MYVRVRVETNARLHGGRETGQCSGLNGLDMQMLTMTAMDANQWMKRSRLIHVAGVASCRGLEDCNVQSSTHDDMGRLCERSLRPTDAPCHGHVNSLPQPLSWTFDSFSGFECYEATSQSHSRLLHRGPAVRNRLHHRDHHHPSPTSRPNALAARSWRGGERF